MPIYEYVCRDCGHQFEWLVRGEEKPSCPSCGRERLTKQLSVPAAHTAAAASGNTCPVQESCGVPNCCGKGCGLAEWF
jgi:putative FmdB family regulatory protein